MNDLFDNVQIGDLQLSNRVVMAPLTRARAGEGDVPTDLMSRYYVQRASAGLIISEATNVSPLSRPFDRAPGLFTDEQVDAWRGLTEKVHEAGGRIFAQLWHGGRIGAMGLLDWQQPISPSGFNDDLENLNVWGLLGNGNYVRVTATPSRAMTRDEVRATVREYRQAAFNAVRAGFDGVEVHAASGYLPHQFLSARVNNRTDEYGGSVSNRARFLEEIVDSIADVLPLSRVGVRISPYAAYNGALDDEVDETYSHVADFLNRRKAAYLHIADTNGWFGAPDLERILAVVAPRFTGALIANGGLTIDAAKQLIEGGRVQLIAFGRHFIANPDLVERIKVGSPLNALREQGLYAGGEAGYTDYPHYS
jgi:2,4-dienoyl-CoA reductase-like NADH-dependent reductase (Old Yellow Enzyme family)